MEKQAKEKQIKEKQGVINLLRICTVCLAVVSFWATAQGMKNYVFIEGWQAYAASLAIQGLLLGLNFYLPLFLKDAKEWWKKSILITLTIIVLFCSSWFSYVYIAGKVYERSWVVESQLLIQDAYRQELYNGSEYIGEYKEYLKESLEEQIFAIYSRAKKIEDSDAQSGEENEEINWETERNQYAPEDFEAKDSMDDSIDAMEKALEDGASLEQRRQASEVIERTKTVIDEQIELLNERIESDYDRLGSAQAALRDAQNSLDNPPPGSDIIALQNAVDRAQAIVDSNQTNLESDSSTERMYQDALNRIIYYETLIGMSQEQGYSKLLNSLKDIQGEIFKEEPDIEAMKTQALQVLEIFQDKNELADSKEEEDNLSLLNEMSRFIDDLETYNIVNISDATFRERMQKVGDKDSIWSKRGENWRSKLEQELNELKLLISSLPIYSGTENSVLYNYDRIGSTKHLDNIIRNYIAEHNSAQQGIVYLLSPYRELAIFSLILAFFFDIAGFVTGVLIYIMSLEKNVWRKNKSDEEEFETEYEEEGEQELWEIIAGSNRYLMLTGNFVKSDGEYIYEAFEEGKEVEVVNSGTNPLGAGLYIGNEDILTPVEPQELSFIATKEGARDGVYLNCFLKYDDHMLAFSDKKDENYKFLANVDGNIPVYHMKHTEMEVFPASNLDQQKAQTMVAALNQRGTMIIAIYVFEV